MKVIHTDKHRLHFPKGELSGGQLVRPYECPKRCDLILHALQAGGFNDLAAPDPLDLDLVRRVHTPEYVRFLQTAWEQWQAQAPKDNQGNPLGDAIPTVIPARRMRQKAPAHIAGQLGYFCMAIETAITAGTWQAAQASAACAVTAQEQLNAGERAAFALCRPPGHHAARDLYGGYCFLNNAAIAVQALRDNGAARVVLLDLDFHHGNGSQDIFYQRDDVLFMSIHGRPEDAFPHFLGYVDELGEGAGEGFNINYPLPPDSGYTAWGAALEDACLRTTRFSADALVVSLGVDTFEHDPLCFFKLTSDDFTIYGERLAQLQLPTLFCMEGGYALEAIGQNTVNVLSGFANA